MRSSLFTGLIANIVWIAIVAVSRPVISLAVYGYRTVHIPVWGELVSLFVASASAAFVARRHHARQSRIAAFAAVPVAVVVIVLGYGSRAEAILPLIMALLGFLLGGVATGRRQAQLDSIEGAPRRE
jgi:hypothetical protein